MLTLSATAKLRHEAGKDGQLPQGLRLVDWTQIQAEYQRHRHAAFPDASGFHARSFEQQWLSHFDGRGFTVTPDSATWRWGLELSGVVGKAHVSTLVNRINYQWSTELDEWYVNDTRGLEHGFTLRAPRSEIRLNVRGGLRAQTAGTGLEFVDDSGTPRMIYTGLAAWDADGKKLPALMTVDSGQVVVTVNDRGAHYPVTIDPIAQQAYLKASNTGNYDYFGRSVAISADTVVVGADGESSSATGVNGDQSDNSALSSGAAYVFVRNGSTWTQQAYLKASNTGVNDRFGTSVAVSGDTVVVGAYFEDSNATGVNGDGNDNGTLDSGAAYVFVRTGATWTQQSYLKASNTHANDKFGSSVTVSGDTIVVGAYSEDSNTTGVNGSQSNSGALDSGAAYIFTRIGIRWSQQAYLKASNTGQNDAFGWRVAISGDTVVVGAYAEASSATGINGDGTNNSAINSGAAYVFVRNGLIWSQQAYLKASNTEAYDYFGLSVSVSGDTVVVGAYGESSNATGVNGDGTNNSISYSGAAYVFVRNGQTWTQQAYLKASNTGASDNFGSSVAISGDIIVVGASGESSNATGVNGDQSNNSETSSGAAYVFVRNGTRWAQQAYLKASNPHHYDFLGTTVAVSGDTALAGAFQEASSATGVNGDQSNSNANASGAAYILVEPPLAINVAVTPAVSSGAGQIYSFQFTHTRGYQSLGVVNILINTTLDGRQACYFAYSLPTNTLYIVADNGDANQISGRVMNGSGTVANSQCSVNLQNSSATGSGDVLTLTLDMSFFPAFGGNKVVYIAARDQATLNTGWQTMGTLAVPPLTATFPKPVGISPSFSSLSSQIVSLTFQDQFAASNLQTAWMLINTAIDGRAACYVAYYRPGNQIYLYPDNGDGAQAASTILTGTNSLSNSQCTISALGSSVVLNGSQLVVTFTVTFKPAFTGNKGVWLAVQTLGGAQTSAWQAVGARSVP